MSLYPEFETEEDLEDVVAYIIDELDYAYEERIPQIAYLTELRKLDEQEEEFTRLTSAEYYIDVGNRLTSPDIQDVLEQFKNDDLVDTSEVKRKVTENGIFGTTTRTEDEPSTVYFNITAEYSLSDHNQELLDAVCGEHRTQDLEELKETVQKTEPFSLPAGQAQSRKIRFGEWYGKKAGAKIKP